MRAIIGIISIVLFVIVKDIFGACIHVPNNDMIEYSCNRGNPNDLNSIPERTEKIQISNMKLSRITRETFSRFGDNLWVLACSSCDIVDIEPDAFKTLTNLQQVRLDNNKLGTVKASWFEGLKYLTYLDLNYNEIETIENGVFTNLPSLVDLRISGNKLQCLNVDELSQLPDLQRMFINRNSEFKCPNAISKVLKEKEVDFERDPEWNKIIEDLVKPETTRSSQYVDWRTTPRTTTSTTPMYRERLIITRPTESPTYKTTTVSYPTFVSHPIYIESTESSRQDWPPKPESPTSHATWWPISSSTPKVDDYDTSQSDLFPLHNELYYPPQVPSSSNVDSYRQIAETTMPNARSTARISWSQGSDEVFNETEFPIIESLAPIHPPQSIESSLHHQKNPEDYQITEHDIQSYSYPLENYQQIDEAAEATVTPTNIQSVDEPLPICNNSSSSIILSFGIFILTIFWTMKRTF